MLCDEALNREAIERDIAKHGLPENLHFVFVPPSQFEARLRRLPGMFYPAYNLWHRRAYKIARRLHEQLWFDLVHQVNLCGFREPGYAWKLDAPFVWGPIGGGQNYPLRFLKGAGWKGAISESIRTVLNACQMHFSPRVGQAARRAKKLLTANSTNARQIAHRCGGKEPVIMVETGFRRDKIAVPHDFLHSGPLRILWSGVFEHRKALDLLLQAVARLPSDVPCEVRILGRGPLEKRWRRIARELNVDSRCKWLGWLSHDEALLQHRWADVFAFTSLRDTTGTVVLESFATGTPVLCLDHQGMADIVTDECGVKLPVTNRAEVIAGMRDTLARWHHNRDELERLGHGALMRADYYDWDLLGERMATVYRDVLGIAGCGSKEPAVTAEGENQICVAPESPIATAAETLESTSWTRRT